MAINLVKKLGLAREFVVKKLECEYVNILSKMHCANDLFDSVIIYDIIHIIKLNCKSISS